MHVQEKASEDTGSNPWRYCVVCRRHHEQGRKHIFTTSHKNKLNEVINKFSEKVFLINAQHS